MEMTLEQLEDLFWNAFDKEVDVRGDNGNGERAGIRAVVEALRDEIENGVKHYAWNEEDVHKAFEEILGSDAGTHGSPELDEDARKLEAMGQDAGPTFAPAADVCEWTREHKSPGSGWLDCKGNRHWLKSECPCCNRSISFKETP